MTVDLVALRAQAEAALQGRYSVGTSAETALALIEVVEAARATEYWLSQMTEDGLPADFSANVTWARTRLRAALAPFEAQT